MDPISSSPSPTTGKALCVYRRLLNALLLKRKLFWVVAVLILVADLGTKDAAISYVTQKKASGEIMRDMATGAQVWWVCDEWLGLVEVYNTGGPWGIGREFPGFLKITRLLALAVILYILAGTPYRKRGQAVALAMVMGGALGNIWDSWTPGHVRDFLHVDLGFHPAHPWPAFNLADSMICCGVILLVMSIMIGFYTDRKQGD